MHWGWIIKHPISTGEGVRGCGGAGCWTGRRFRVVVGGAHATVFRIFDILNNYTACRRFTDLFTSTTDTAGGKWNWKCFNSRHDCAALNGELTVRASWGRLSTAADNEIIPRWDNNVTELLWTHSHSINVLSLLQRHLLVFSTAQNKLSLCLIYIAIYHKVLQLWSRKDVADDNHYPFHEV